MANEQKKHDEKKVLKTDPKPLKKGQELLKENKQFSKRIMVGG